MSTTYTLECDSAGSIMTLTIIDSINPLPGSDTWSCDPTFSMSTANGTVGSWGTKTTYLHTGGAGAVAELESFGKNTQVGDSGIGSKTDLDGTFPTGHFSWRCTERE